MNELITNGVWKERAGEMSPVEFEYLNETGKMTYLQKIILIQKQERSTYEKIILDRYLKGNYNFKIDTSTEIGEVCAPSPIDNEIGATFSIEEEDFEIYPTEDELVTYGKKYVEEYLNYIFANENSRWKDDLKFASSNDFIKNTKNYMNINELTVLHIKAYKRLL